MAVTVNSSSTIHQGRVFKMIQQNVTLDNGVTIDIDTIQHPGAAAIVPLTENGSVILLRQYRHSVGGYIWEIPAGTLDAGESALACARRELVEETGYTARHFEKLATITPLPAYSDERIHIFQATGLESACQNLDADELLSVHAVELPRCLEMIVAGEIQDAKTICGLQLAAGRLG